MSETKIPKEMPSNCDCCPIKRCGDDHNTCLEKCDLSESCALILFILSLFGLGGLSLMCYECCSKTDQSPRWIWKNFIWLSIWMSLLGPIGWIWQIVFCFQAYKVCKGKTTDCKEQCC